MAYNGVLGVTPKINLIGVLDNKAKMDSRYIWMIYKEPDRLITPDESDWHILGEQIGAISNLNLRLI